MLLSHADAYCLPFAVNVTINLYNCQPHIFPTFRAPVTIDLRFVASISISRPARVLRTHTYSRGNNQQLQG